MSYAELHCKTNFSFLEGASHPSELVERAAELGYNSLAITDRNSVAGVVRAHAAAKPLGLKLLIGAEITPHDAPPVVLLATDRAAYGRLARLITRGRRAAEKGECHLSLDDVAEYAEGLVAAVVPKHAAAGRAGMPGADEGACASDLSKVEFVQSLRTYREIFSQRCYLLAEVHHGPDDTRQLVQLGAIARQAEVLPVAAGGVHFHVPQRRALCDVLTATRLGMTVDEARDRLFANAERYLKPVDELHSLFREMPGAMARTVEIAEQCTFSLDQLRYEYPEELVPAGTKAIDFLTELTWQGACRRYPDGLPEKAAALLRHELELIRELKYEAYFLTVWDLVRFARRRGILCQGRGSAANSAVCYCLGVTSVDPAQMDLLFERFVSRERGEAPDIDVDFEHERREEVLQYIYEKYGRERVGMTAEVITYRTRSAIRDVGKALGLSVDRVDALSRSIEVRGDPQFETRFAEAGLDPDSEVAQRLIPLVKELRGFPRHLSQHVGGMVMTAGALCELVPIENAAMADRTVIQWNKDDLDELGILKVDCLSLGMLTAIRKAFEMVERHGLSRGGAGRRLTLANLPPEDPQVYEMIRRADTVGVFQIESRAQMSMLPRLRPRCYYDLVVEVAIVRPGPIQGNMVHPYLRRRMGQEAVTYPNDEIRQVLEKTLGVPIFQEQAMRLAVVAANFTPGEADELRRAMAAWRRTGTIERFRVKLLEGMKSNGLSDEFAENVFRQLRGFGEYGFPESHAASFALLVYVSAWLKCHYPEVFAAAVINSQPMGFYAPAQLVRDAREHGVEVRGIDVNYSSWDCTLEESATEGQATGSGGREMERSGNPSKKNMALRLGFRMLGGMRRTDAETIVHERAAGPYRSIEQLAVRTGLPRSTIVRLSDADAFASLGLDRRGALWDSLAQEASARELPLFDQVAGASDAADGDFLDAEDEWTAAGIAELPEMGAEEQVYADYRAVGLSLRAHPVSFYRQQLVKLRVSPSCELQTRRAERPVRVAGLVLLRQRPSTAKGITFVTLEDETGTANLVIRPQIWERYYRVAKTSSAMIAHGKLERKHGVIHVVVNKLEDMKGRIHAMSSQSRDFR